jgi:hypothetical protein
MKDRGDWIQIIVFLIFVGLGVARVVIAKFWNKMQDDEPPPRRPKSPAIEMLERMRAESEQATAVLKEDAPAPAPGARATGHGSDIVHYDGSDDEDAFFGDDGLSGQRAMPEDAAGWRLSPRAPRATRPVDPRSTLADQYALDWENVGTSESRSPPPVPGLGSRSRRLVESGDIDLSASHPRSPREQVLHPRTETTRRAIASPRAAGEHIAISRELDLADTAADLGMRQLAPAQTAPTDVPLRGLLKREGMTLRQALIGQIIFGPPKSRGG